MPSRGDNLHLAASRGKTYRVAACLANDEDPNSPDAHGRTPLTISAKGGNVEVFIIRTHIFAQSASMQGRDGCSKRCATSPSPPP